MNPLSTHPRLCDTLITIGLMLVSTILSLLCFLSTVNSVNIAFIYILALILTARYTSGYFYGVIFSVFCVFCVNFFFTYPHWALDFSLQGYPVTFIVMLVITLITSAATSHSKIQAKLLAEREEMLQLAEKEKMHANLLRAVSHDLRTPLTSIIGSANSILESGDYLSTQEKATMLSHIQEDASWLLDMVENLLSITKIQGGAATVKTTCHVLEEVVGEALVRFKKRHPQMEIELTAPDEVVFVQVDALLIEQIILNLLENAFLYSQSTVPVRMSVSVASDSDEVALSVRDFGKGIDPKIIDTIFDGVARLHTLSDSHKGMGIGLSICKTIISAHHGEIFALNHKEGAEFRFTLPIYKENEV